jgi:hypothetical protein
VKKDNVISVVALAIAFLSIGVGSASGQSLPDCPKGTYLLIVQQVPTGGLNSFAASACRTKKDKDRLFELPNKASPRNPSSCQIGKVRLTFGWIRDFVPNSGQFDMAEVAACYTRDDAARILQEHADASRP